MSKSLLAWANIYGAGVLVMGDTIFARDGENSQIQRVLLKGRGLEIS